MPIDEDPMDWGVMRGVMQGVTYRANESGVINYLRCSQTDITCDATDVTCDAVTE